MLGQARDLLAVALKVITEPPLRTSLLAHIAYLAQTQGDMAAAIPLMNEASALPRLPMTDVHLVFVEATHLFYVEGSADCVPLYAHVVELSRDFASPGDTYITELLHTMAACFLHDAMHSHLSESCIRGIDKHSNLYLTRPYFRLLWSTN